MRTRPQLRQQALPGLGVRGIFGVAGLIAIDHRKLDLDAVQHHHVFRFALGELAQIRKKQASLDGYVADQRLDRGDAVVQRRLGIVERYNGDGP